MRPSSSTDESSASDAVSPIVDQDPWAAALDEIRGREKAVTRELDAGDRR